MLPWIIEWSVANKLIVLVFAAAAAAAGIVAMRRTPLEALPDLSDVQVIVQTEYPGQAPQIVEDQLTYPIATEMLKVPGARAVRGYSFFGVSFVYVIFDDGVDLYWARSRVLEYLSGIRGKLPAAAKTRTMSLLATDHSMIRGSIGHSSLSASPGPMSIPGIASIAEPMLDSASMRKLAEATTDSPSARPDRTSIFRPATSPVVTSRAASMPSGRRRKT